MKPVLDACCGGKAFWFDKHDSRALFVDIRQEDDVLCDGRTLRIEPDMVADFRALPFPTESFYCVVFDPPHLLRAGESSWLAKKYGRLDSGWRDDLKQGFAECFRVLRPNGLLIFKWNEDQIALRDVLCLTKEKPLFGNRRAKTHWIVYMKEGKP